MAGRTETSIANMAADFLDSSAIGNINDDFGDAVIWKRNYPEAIETVLSEFKWNGTVARARLTAITPELKLDTTDFENAYSLPSDCLIPIDVNGRPLEKTNWEVETIANVDAHGNVISRNRVFWCDASGDIVLRYQAIIRPRDMSAHLAKACAIELAIRSCNKLANSTSKMKDLREAYAEATKGSIRRVGGFQVDSRQNKPKPRVNHTSNIARARAGHGL